MPSPSSPQTAYRYYSLIGIAFVAVLLISNTIASKILQLGPFSITGGIVLFPISYIFGDVLTEVYGYRGSRPIIWAGFAAQLLMLLTYTLVQHLPAAPFWTHQEAYDVILGSVPRIVLASMVAYFAGEFSNSYVLSRMKVRMQGKRLWMRTIGSTVIGEGVDTILFVLIALGGTLPLRALVVIIASGYLLKVVYEIIATPITYRIVRSLKRAEGVDVFDQGISYNPFRN